MNTKLRNSKWNFAIDWQINNCVQGQTRYGCTYRLPALSLQINGLKSRTAIEKSTFSIAKPNLSFSVQFALYQFWYSVPNKRQTFAYRDQGNECGKSLFLREMKPGGWANGHSGANRKVRGCHTARILCQIVFLNDVTRREQPIGKQSTGNTKIATSTQASRVSSCSQLRFGASRQTLLVGRPARLLVFDSSLNAQSHIAIERTEQKSKRRSF